MKKSVHLVMHVNFENGLIWDLGGFKQRTAVSCLSKEVGNERREGVDSREKQEQEGRVLVGKTQGNR
jgi:hypothetical protein